MKQQIIKSLINQNVLELSYKMSENNNIPYLDRMVSVYNNVKEKQGRTMRLREFLFDLGLQRKEQIMRLRSLTDKDEQKRMKMMLPQATISGVFLGERKAAELSAHTGLICVDIDAKDNPDVPDFGHLKENILSRLDEVLYAARSVSGKGYFVIIPLKYPKQHQRQFRQLQLDFAKIGITIDNACSDVSRLRCVSYDEVPYKNEKAKAYIGIEEQKTKPVYQPAYRNKFADDTDERVYLACRNIERFGIDMTENYDDWISIGFSLATLGESGREYYHIVSRQSPKYNQRETDQKFNSFLRTGASHHSIGTFFYFYKRFVV